MINKIWNLENTKYQESLDEKTSDGKIIKEFLGKFEESDKQEVIS